MTNCAQGVMLRSSWAQVLWGMIVEITSVMTNTPTGSHSLLLNWPPIWTRVDISTWWNRGTSDWNCILQLNCRKPSTWSCMRNLTTSSKWTKPPTSPYTAPLFRGVYPNNRLPPICEGLYVIDKAPHTHPGLHWISLFVKESTIVYFDSYGGDPVSTLRRWGKKNQWSTNPGPLQSPLTSVSGQYC